MLCRFDKFTVVALKLYFNVMYVIILEEPKLTHITNEVAGNALIEVVRLDRASITWTARISPDCP